MNRRVYVGLAVVFAASVGLIIVLPRAGVVATVIRDLSGVPAVGALCLALFQLARDRIAFDRSVLAQQLQNSFAIGATSHMAIVAFDKHVAFSEEYVSAMFDILESLFRTGPHSDALNGASTLVAIRKKWSLWITPEVEIDLEGFERALREMGAAANVVESFPGTAEHVALVKKMYIKFMEVMGSKVTGSSEWEGKQITEDVALYTIIRKLQKVLGVEELSNLREKFVTQALEQDEI